MKKHELVLAEVSAMERRFEERQRVLKEFNIRAFGVRVNPLCSVYGLSEGIMGRGCMGSGSQMWALRSPLLFRFRDGDGNLSSLVSFCAAGTVQTNHYSRLVYYTES